jgi:hypothetical protein
MTPNTRSALRGVVDAGAGEKERVIMTSKRVFGVLAVIALLGVSAVEAQAGAGGSPSPLTSFFVCNSISGEDAARRVDVQSSFWNFNPLNVRIGNATLACAFAKLFVPGTSTEISPTPAGELKCYAVSVQRGTRSATNPPSYDVTDDLLGNDPAVTGSSLQYICGPATFNLNP